MHKLKSYTIEGLFNIDEADEGIVNDVYFQPEVDEIIIELSNIIFSLEQSLNNEWKKILRKDIKKIKQLRKKGIIYGKYISNKD